MKLFFNSLYTISKPQKKLKANPNAVDGSASIQPGHETQRSINLSPIWNHEPSPTVKKLKVSPEDCFFAQIYMMQAQWSNSL